MTNEEFQNLVLQELRGIKGDISGLKEDVSGLKEDVCGLKEDVCELKERMNNVESQLDENTQIVKAIRHNQEYTNAKLDKLEATTADIKGLQKVKSEVNMLGAKVYELAVAK